MIASLLTLALATPTQVQANAAAVLLANDGAETVRLSSADASDPPPGMVFIPGGETVMGTAEKELARLGDGNRTTLMEVVAEFPRHEISVDPFFIDKFEVTNRQWMAYVEATGQEVNPWIAEHSWGGSPTIPEGTEDHPITNVNYPEIMEFMAWCGKRLPTEEEWTLAARGAGDTRLYPWGERWRKQNCQSASTMPQQPVAVYEHEAGTSPYGLYNMAGNVWEWVDSPYSPYDDFEPYPFKVGRKKEMLSPEFDGTSKIIKGGSYFAPRNALRIDYRHKMGATASDKEVGFRAARSAIKGQDILTHAYRRLQPSQIPDISGLDFSQQLAEEFYDRAPAGGSATVITGYRYLAFAPPIPQRGSGLAKLRKSTRDEPLTLGLLTTSEPLAEPALPPGDYLLAYKGAGESKAYKQKRRDEKKGGSQKPKGEPAEATPADPTRPQGASAPWPGVNVSAIKEDIDFPQEQEVILFYNVNGAVVAWLPLMPDAYETKKSPGTLTNENDDGVSWTLEYSWDNVPRNGKMPRFTVPLKLYGEGLGN